MSSEQIRMTKFSHGRWNQFPHDEWLSHLFLFSIGRPYGSTPGQKHDSQQRQYRIHLAHLPPWVFTLGGLSQKQQHAIAP